MENEADKEARKQAKIKNRKIEKSEEKQQDKDEILGAIRVAVEKLQSPIISRELAAELLGGAMSARYLANLDSKKEGVPHAFKMGRRQCYLAPNLMKWIESRLEV